MQVILNPSYLSFSRRKQLKLYDMNVVPESLLLDDLFAPYRQMLGADYDGYRNHCLRVFNFCCALAGKNADTDKIAVAAFFHDIGIWSDNTLTTSVPPNCLPVVILRKQTGMPGVMK